MERTVGTHAVYTVPTRLVTDSTEVASYNVGCADGFYGKSCDRGNADWKTVMSMTHFM